MDGPLFDLQMEIILEALIFFGKPHMKMAKIICALEKIGTASVFSLITLTENRTLDSRNLPKNPKTEILYHQKP